MADREGKGRKGDSDGRRETRERWRWAAGGTRLRSRRPDPGVAGEIGAGLTTAGEGTKPRVRLEERRSGCEAPAGEWGCAGRLERRHAGVVLN